MSVRAKFTVLVVESVPGSTEARRVVLEPRYDQDTPEDQRYSKYTPSGRIEMTIDNPPALAQFQPGKTFYVDFSAVDG